MKNKILLLILFSLFWVAPSGFALNLPYVNFFPLAPNFSFSLKSDKGNIINVQETIELSENYEEIGVLFVNWKVKLTKNNRDINYLIRMRVDEFGNVYLSEIADGLYTRFFTGEDPIIPLSVKWNDAIHVGENLSFTYTGKKDSLTVNLENDRKAVFRNVTVGTLLMGEEKITVYLSAGQGIVGIKTDDETYRYNPK